MGCGASRSEQQLHLQSLQKRRRKKKDAEDAECCLEQSQLKRMVGGEVSDKVWPEEQLGGKRDAVEAGDDENAEETEACSFGMMMLSRSVVRVGQGLNNADEEDQTQIGVDADVAVGNAAGAASSSPVDVGAVLGRKATIHAAELANRDEEDEEQSDEEMSKSQGNLDLDDNASFSSSLRESDLESIDSALAKILVNCYSSARQLDEANETASKPPGFGNDYDLP